MEALVDPAGDIIKEYMRRGYVINHNAVSEQKYEDLKRAVGLLENVSMLHMIMLWRPSGA